MTYFNPRLAADLFFLFRSTGSKQTLNGLFYVFSRFRLVNRDYQSSFLTPKRN